MIEILKNHFIFYSFDFKNFLLAKKIPMKVKKMLPRPSISHFNPRSCAH